jgi:hypothetical protein
MERVLSCSCGHRILITHAQAGSRIICSRCGTELAVPTLRGLADLPLAENEEQVPQKAKSHQAAWGWRGPVMAICSSVMIICLGFACYNFYIWGRIDTSRDIEGHLQVVQEVFDSAGPDQLSHLWDEYAGVSLRRPMPTDYKVYSDFANNKLRIASITGGVALALLLSLLILGFTANRRRAPA